MSSSKFEQELLQLLKEVRNELRIIRYAKQAELSKTKSDSLVILMDHDVEVHGYDNSIKLK